MTRRELIYDIERYCPFNEQEEKDKALILNWIKTNDNAFSRENAVAHMTASAWVVNKDRSKVLMVYHNIYHSWSWLGASLLTTEQGIAINEKGQALDDNNQPMEGLYITGDMSGSFFANNYPCLMAGVAMGRTLTFAMKAVKQMAGLDNA